MQETNPTHVGSNPLAEAFQDPSVQPRRATFEAGASVFEPNDPAASLYYVHRGQIRVFQVGPNDEQRLVEILGPDDWFGAPALARQAVCGTRAVAVSAAIVTEVRVQRLLDAMLHKPAAMAELLRQTAARLQTAREESANLIFQDCNNRLVDTLLRFSNTAAASRSDQGVVLRITHQQLAQAVGVARETVSLALTQLRQKHLLQTGRNQLTFNPDTLRQFKAHVREKTPAEAHQH